MGNRLAKLIFIVLGSSFIFLYLDYKATIYDRHIIGLFEEELLFDSELLVFPENKYSLYSKNGYPIVLCVDDNSVFPIPSPNQRTNRFNDRIEVSEIIGFTENSKALFLLVLDSDSTRNIIAISGEVNDSIVSKYEVLSEEEYNNLNLGLSWNLLTEDSISYRFFKLWRIIGLVFIMVMGVFVILFLVLTSNRRKT